MESRARPRLGALLCVGALTLPGVLPGCRGQSGGGGPSLEPRGSVTGRIPPMPMPRPVRAIWVTRFDYRYADDVRTIIRNCAQLGCNSVFWQVRGAGTVAYPSRLEPWGPEFDFASPGFDPLAVAVEEAHRHRLRIEAWVNTLPGWRGSRPPPLPDQLWNAHPDWFIMDAAGSRQPLGDHYLILNPCLPAVRQHLARLVEEIVSRYNVDGVHLDYVRFAWDDEKNAAQRYPRDGRTVAIYRRETGLRPDDDAGAWKHWRANQLTRLVSEVRTTVNRRRPGATLTAAVTRNPRSAYDQFFQNGVAWARAGLVDALMPMAYTENTELFDADISAYRQLVNPLRIVPAVGIYQHKTPEIMRDQLRRCVAWGGNFGVYAYAALHPTHADRSGKTDPSITPTARAWRRDVLAEFLGQR